jgi:lipid-binding SYLF domain-containing protein
MKMSLWLVPAALAWLALPLGTARAGRSEVATVESAIEVINALSNIPVRGIPPALLQDAQGVAIIPNVLKAGFVIGGRHGCGVLLIRQPDGWWSNPIFVSLTGGSIGWQIGVQSTDVVLVFRTRAGLERIMRGKGKLTLGADVSVAAGPVGRQAEADTDAQLKSEIYSYSRSRGLFAGLSLEGAALLVDHSANEDYYDVRRIRPEMILAPKDLAVPASAVKLSAELNRLSGPGVVVVPPPVVAPGPPIQAVPMPPPPPAPAPLPPPRPLPPAPPY